MKLEPMITALAPDLARSAIARASASERRVNTLSRSNPGVLSRLGSAPVARSSLSNGTHGGDLDAEAKVDAIVAVPVVRAQRDPFLRSGSGEIILGEVRPVAGRIAVRAQHDDRAFITELAELVGAGEPCRSPADDHDLLGVSCRAFLLLRLSDLLADEGTIPFDFDLPPVDRIEGRSTKHLARTQVEAGVVKRAADRSAADESVSECAAIMGARAADGEQLAVETREEHRLVTHPAGERRAFGNFRELHTLGKIRSCYLGISAHRR